MLRHLLNLIYPIYCPVCKVKLDEGMLCQDCLRGIRRIAPAFNQIIYDKAGIYYRRLYSVCVYEGVLKELIHLFKYNRRRSLANIFNGLITEFAHNNLDMSQFDIIVPVPLHGIRLREREFNQAESMAGPLSKNFDIPLSRGKLKRIKATLSQSNLKKEARFLNLRNAFRVKDPEFFKGKRVLIVDDVFTTGATVNECAKTLLASGAKDISVLTLARGE